MPNAQVGGTHRAHLCPMRRPAASVQGVDVSLDPLPRPLLLLAPPPAQGVNVSLVAIEAVLDEIAALSPDNCMHLGGDEVDQTCWQNDPATQVRSCALEARQRGWRLDRRHEPRPFAAQAWMTAHGMGNNTDLVYEYFVNQVDAMSLADGKSPIRWEEGGLRCGRWTTRQRVLHALHCLALQSGRILARSSTSARSSTVCGVWRASGCTVSASLCAAAAAAAAAVQPGSRRTPFWMRRARATRWAAPVGCGIAPAVSIPA